MASPDHVLNTPDAWSVEGMPVAPPGRMSEDEFVAWCGDEVRAEWVDGEVIVMSPASADHDDLVGWLLAVLRPFAERHNLGTVRGPELQVRLIPGRRRIPDVLFVSTGRESILQANYVEGAPDLAIEIVSPDSQARDWREKYLDYQAAGVREYWVIDLASQRAEFYHLDDGGQYSRLEEVDGAITSQVLTGLRLPLAWLWPAGRPKVIDALGKLGLL